MNPFPPVAARLFELGIPELVVVIIILLVLFWKIQNPDKGALHDSGSGMTRKEIHVLIAFGAILTALIAVLVLGGISR